MEKTAEQTTASSSSWERETLEKMLLLTIKEQRTARRWRIFFRFFFTFLIIGIIFLAFGESATPGKSQTAMIDIKGEIADEGKNSAKNIVEGLTNAFKDKDTKGIILNINSPGGSPVQASEIYSEILSLRKTYPKVKVYAVCSDICASGGYYIAAAADEIHANKASMVGSIGVILRGFGFVDSLQKVGATRRLLTSGSEKDFMDPFLPLKTEDVAHMQTMLDIVHKQFINDIKFRRGTKLKDDPELFSGLIWTGEQALALGLIDGIGSTHSVATDIIKEDNIVDFTVRNDILTRFATNVGASATEQVASMMKFKLY